MDNYNKTIKKVGIVTITLNILLSLGKVIAGIFAHSNALISDGIHSISDVLSTLVVMVGAKLSRKKADKEHPFGHERIESVCAMILAGLLILTALILGYTAVLALIRFGDGKTKKATDFLLYIGMGFAILSIVVKGWMYLYTKKEAKKIKSEILHADAIHHLTDSLSSFASLLGIIGLIIGDNFDILDPIASLIICVFIFKVSHDIGKKGIEEILDTSASDEFNQSIRNDVLTFKEVVRINSLKTRLFADKIYVEIEIAVDDYMTVKDAHAVSLKIHNMLEEKYKEIKHCMIHIDPKSLLEHEE